MTVSDLVQPLRSGDACQTSFSQDQQRWLEAKWNTLWRSHLISDTHNDLCFCVALLIWRCYESIEEMVIRSETGNMQIFFLFNTKFIIIIILKSIPVLKAIVRSQLEVEWCLQSVEAHWSRLLSSVRSRHIKWQRRCAYLSVSIVTCTEPPTQTQLFERHSPDWRFALTQCVDIVRDVAWFARNKYC